MHCDVLRSSSRCWVASTCRTAADAQPCTTLPSTATLRYCRDEPLISCPECCFLTARSVLSVKWNHLHSCSSIVSSLLLHRCSSPTNRLWCNHPFVLFLRIAQVGQCSCITGLSSGLFILTHSQFTHIPNLKLTIMGGRFLKLHWMDGFSVSVQQPLQSVYATTEAKWWDVFTMWLYKDHHHTQTHTNTNTSAHTYCMACCI